MSVSTPEPLSERDDAPAEGVAPVPSALAPWPVAAGRALDAVGVVLAIVLGTCVAFDLALPGRPVLALVFFIAVPGWACLRACRAPACSLAAFAAIALSVSLTILFGQVLVSQLDWSWQPATVVIAVGSAAGLVIPWFRR
jgi:hypothetical protein